MTKKNYRIVGIIAFVSILLGAFVGGYMSPILGSETGTVKGATVVIPIGAPEQEVYGKTITSDLGTHQFYVEGTPIDNGQTVHGVKLISQKEDAGLFMFPAVASLSVLSITESQISPPLSAGVSPISPTAGELFYIDSDGYWEQEKGDRVYTGLSYEIYDEDGNQIDFAGTTFGKRDGYYNTLERNAEGNVDPITGEDTIYKQLSSSCATPGQYQLKVKEYYSGVGTVSKTSSFVIQRDKTFIPARVISFSAPSTVKEGRNIVFNFDYEGTDVSYAKIYHDSGTVWNVNGGTLVAGDGPIRCGNNVFRLYLYNSDGKLLAQSNRIRVSVACTVQTPPVTVYEIVDNKCVKKEVPESEAGNDRYFNTKDACESALPTDNEDQPQEDNTTSTKVVRYDSSDGCKRIEVPKSEADASNYYSKFDVCKASIRDTGGPEGNPLVFLISTISIFGVGYGLYRRF